MTTRQVDISYRDGLAMGVAVDTNREAGRKSPEWMERAADYFRTGSRGVTLLIRDGEVEVTPDGSNTDRAVPKETVSAPHQNDLYDGILVVPTTVSRPSAETILRFRRSVGLPDRELALESDGLAELLTDILGLPERQRRQGVSLVNELMATGKDGPSVDLFVGGAGLGMSDDVEAAPKSA